jgi:hypothetical protein
MLAEPIEKDVLVLVSEIDVDRADEFVELVEKLFM